MTPYQIGFLACRLMAVYCLVSAAWAFAVAYSTIKTMTAANPEFSSQVVFVTPFAVMGLLTILLWAKASWFASVFVPDAAAKESKLDAEGFASALFRAVGLYFIVLSLPGTMSWIVELCQPEHPSESAMKWMADLSRDPGLGSVIRLVLGLGLFVGFRRLGAMVQAAPKRYMDATSLVDESDEASR